MQFFHIQEVPWDAETYLHRIGRAGRFGSYGVSVSLPSEGYELDILRNIAFQTGSQISILPYNPTAKECLPDLWKIQQVGDINKICSFEFIFLFLLNKVGFIFRNFLFFVALIMVYFWCSTHGAEIKPIKCCLFAT